MGPQAPCLPQTLIPPPLVMPHVSAASLGKLCLTHRAAGPSCRPALQGAMMDALEVNSELLKQIQLHQYLLALLCTMVLKVFRSFGFYKN